MIIPAVPRTIKVRQPDFCLSSQGLVEQEAMSNGLQEFCDNGGYRVVLVPEIADLGEVPVEALEQCLRETTHLQGSDRVLLVFDGEDPELPRLISAEGFERLVFLGADTAVRRWGTGAVADEWLVKMQPVAIGLHPEFYPLCSSKLPGAIRQKVEDLRHLLGASWLVGLH
ncbi:hypothetical protein SAMN02745129_2070 [Ferrimonas marina]|uniref:Uncharacterized protein n=2 Tax=Ferrimonas marina TaxID=299255 RepID=A0A1M5TBC1_9GAMM|nr:hypothetical protein SAMN02745129_2070 [Ferrimonas marina]